MVERWKPLPASAYKEDFRLRTPALPPSYKSTPAKAVRRNRALPISSARFTNPDKVLWPQEGYTKADVITYYAALSEILLPHLSGRPIIMERYPNGIAEKYFLQKDAMPQHTPDWLLPHVHEVYAPEVRRNVRYIIADNRDVLLYLANYGVITLHPWTSRIKSLDYPDYVLFDLDPADAPFDTVKTVALELKAVLDELRVRSYLKTSGVSGLHVYIPVREGSISYRDARMFAEAIARIVAQRTPETTTVTRTVSRRTPGKVYLDYLQNGRGKTLAGIYSLRARPGAPVSTPLKWSELKSRPITPTAFNLETVPKRIRSLGDLFLPVLRDKQDIRHLVDALRIR
jgi:bifunctional non-homologous end joining protein LigD